MATANFPLVRTSKYYAFGMNKYITQEGIDAFNYSQEMLGEYDEDGTLCNYEFYRDNAKEELDRLGYFETDERDVFMRLSHYFDFCGIEFRIKIDVKLEYGYYEGAVWDFDALIDTGCWTGAFDLPLESPLSAKEMFDNDFHNNFGLLKMQEKNINKKIEAEYEKLVAELEQVFVNNCDEHLRLVGSFSNGETLYESVA